MKKTLILGATEKADRYANLAANRLKSKGHPIVNVGFKEGVVAGEPIVTDQNTPPNDVHTITMYLSAKSQTDWYDYVIAVQPKRIIFNPGAENPELAQMAQAKGIETVEACTLVLLSIGSY